MSNKIFEKKPIELSKSQKFAYSIICLSISLILSYVEAIFPLDIGGLGVKVGFANIITLIALQILDIKKTLIINILRTVIIGIMFGNIIRFILSLSGFLLSFVIMTIMLKKLNFSIITSSVFGGVSHNLGQIISLAIILKNRQIFTLVPFYTIVGIVAGIIIGILSDIIYKKISILHLNNM